MPLDIDAVLFWLVWNPKDACVEVEDYAAAIWWAAQTALRDAIGRINLAEVATRREQLDCEIKEILDEKTRSWGSPWCPWSPRHRHSQGSCKMPCPARPKPERERNARLLLAETRRTSPRCSWSGPPCTIRTTRPCSCAP